MEETSPTKIAAPPGAPEIVITRVFDAPRDTVFKANTNPDLIPRWWGPESYTTAVDAMEVRKGGAWRFVQRGPDGNEYAFSGIYREVVPPERLAYTFNFEAMPGHETLETVTFEEDDGKTRVTDKVLFQTVEDRDGMLASGMAKGATESMDRFAGVLKELRQR